MLDRYVIVERIAVGGMGEVFVARQHGVGNFRRTVVLKRLLPDAEGNDEAAHRLLDEARISGSLSHENVVGIIEVGEKEDGGDPWLALEYVHGENAGTLRSKAGKRDIAIPVVVAARIVADAARGLHHAHEANDADGRPMNIIHRDIAPKNIFVRHDGVAKVGDFGIAHADSRMSRTATGAVAGTLSYMSPEQLIGAAAAKALTPHSDQFALGIVLWELLTGRRLFKGEGPVETAEKILQGKIRPPSRYREDASALDAVVLRMLDREPTRRFADCGEVAHAIEAALPDAAIAVGRAAVAAFVEEMVGPELRERQRRIEEGAEQTVRADRPPDAKQRAWEDPSSSRRNARQPTTAVTGQGANGDATLPDRPQHLQGQHGQLAPVTSSTAQNNASPPSRGQQSRSVFVGAAVAVFVIAAAIVVVGVLGRAPAEADPEVVLREHLHRAAAIKPLSFREVVVVDAMAAGVPAADAERLADDLTALMRERLTLVVAHHDKPAAERLRERVDVSKGERAIIERVQARLAVLADSELRTGLLDMWQYDSSVPIRFLPPLTLAQIQARIYPNGIELLKETREERWQQVALLARRAGADPAAVRARLQPLVTKREELIFQFGTAAPDDLAGLEDAAAAVADSGAAALKGLVRDDYAAAIAYVAFISIPSSKRGEPEIDEHADTRSN